MMAEKYNISENILLVHLLVTKRVRYTMAIILIINYSFMDRVFLTYDYFLHS